MVTSEFFIIGCSVAQTLQNKKSDVYETLKVNPPHPTHGILLTPQVHP